MSAQELIRKTKFEAQVPYTLIGEIAEAVKKSEENLPVFPSEGFMKIERIQEWFYRLGYIICEEGEDPRFNIAARGYALTLIAETIRFINTLPPPTPHTTDTRKASSKS